MVLRTLIELCNQYSLIDRNVRTEDFYITETREVV